MLTVTGADPSMLELELTETQLVEDLDWASATLEEIRRRGVTIAIDDFGTGYSSMTYLRRLPVDTIKIDRSFIANATESGYDATIVDALLTIGKTLGVDGRRRGRRDPGPVRLRARRAACTACRATCSPGRCRSPTPRR